MTQAEYKALYTQASNTMPRLTLSAVNKLRQVYIDAAAEVAQKVIDLEKRGVSVITTNALSNLQFELEKGAALIQEALNEYVPITVKLGLNEVQNINEEYMFEIAQYANGKITQTGIKSMLSAVNNAVNMSTVSRIFSDGYTFSERVWRAGAKFQNDIKNIVAAGTAQGRDILDIARDINIYAKEDKLTLISRYGDLLAGTKEFTKRIGKNIYFPSLRIVRSELYASLMDHSKLIGQYNPGCSGLWDWVRTGLTDWNCACPQYAADSPYELQKIPAYPHPLCLCKLVPRLRNQNDFIKDLKAWGNGESIDYLDNWYNTKYPLIPGVMAA